MNKKQRDIDQNLVLEYQSGNKKALAILVKRWHKLFCEKSFWIVKDADVAKDVAQESWNTIINKLSELKDSSAFGSWALRIVYNKSIDAVNANNKRIKKVEDYKHSQVELVDNEENSSELIKSKLLETIKSLSIQQQQVIQLFYVQNYSLKQISKLLNISVGTVKSRLFHAREKLKQILKDRNYEK